MAALKRLLVATDFSAMADDAIERAALIAKDAGASLDLIHIATPALLERARRLAEETPVEAEQDSSASVQETLNKQAAAVWARHGLSGGVRLASGSLVRELAEHAGKLAADLVVLGFCGASLVRHFLLGSTAERLLTEAPCPILVVKKRPYDRYRSVLVPVDFSAISIPSLAGARSLAPEARMSVLHVFKAPFEGKLRYAGVGEETIAHYRNLAQHEVMQKLLLLCTEAEIDPHGIRLLAVHGHPSQRIVAREAHQNCDLIVMGRQGENVFENLFVGSVTRRVIAKSGCDVLICV